MLTQKPSTSQQSQRSTQEQKSPQPELIAGNAALQLLTVKEAAQFLRVSESTIRNAIRDGTLPAFRFGKRRGTIRIRECDLQAYLAACKSDHSPATFTSHSADGQPFQCLDSQRLLDAWRRAGVLSGPSGEHNVPSSGSTCDPTARRGS